jgi:hypothetical protein
MKKIFFISIALLTVLALSSPVLATTITTHMTADDGFNLYISTSDSTLGTLVGTHNWWYDTQTFTNALTPGVTNYIHIQAWDSYTVAVGLLGDFTLSDSNFKFANGTQNLVTNITDWQGYTDGFGGTSGTLVNEGLNGVSPWGLRSDIAASANWIWVNPVLANYETRYFSTAIFYNTTVPEPATMLLLGLGLAGLAGFRKKFKRG